MLGRQFCLTRDERRFELPKIATRFDDNCENNKNYHMQNYKNMFWEYMRYDYALKAFYSCILALLFFVINSGPYRKRCSHIQYFLMERAIWRWMLFHLGSINYVNAEINIESDFHILRKCSWQFSSCIFQATWKPDHYEQFTQRNLTNKCGSSWELKRWLRLLVLFSERFRIIRASLSDP